MSSLFRDVVVPLLTPLDAEERIDRDALRRLIEFVLRGGAQGLFVLGSNGEGAALGPAQRKQVAAEAMAIVAGRVPVLAGALEPSTGRVIEQIRDLSDLGIAGFVVTTPFYYNGYSDAELADHFRRAADASPAPILLYNIPQNTKVALRANVVASLMKVENIAGLKDSSGDWTEFQAMLLDPRRPPQFTMLQGMQSLSAVSMIAGADGLVPGHGNVCPDLLVTLCAAARRGDVATAMSLQGRLDRLLAVRGRAGLHANKVVAKRLGLMEDHITRPLPRMSASEAEQFIEATERAGMEFPRPPTARS